MRRRADNHEKAAMEWSPARLLVLAGSCVLVVLAIVTGLAIAVFAALHKEPDAGEARYAAGRAIRSLSEQDALAAAPMPTAEPEEALPGPLSSRAAEVVVLPRPTAVGLAEVATGFPRTPEGALAQLAAIDVTAMQSGSMDGVRSVIAEWATTGGPTSENWSGVTGMASLLSGAGLSAAGSPQLAIVVRPVMGLIKGTVGSDFAVVCVDLEFTVSLERTARMAVADCQRMTWVADRWLIGPGPEPAPAPSIWPGTDAAIDAGWRDLRHA